MRSNASLNGHPLHPALIPFPFAFLTGALLFDLLGIVFDRPALWTTAAHLTLAGIVTGLLAAVPGIVDYVYTVPPKSSGRKRARTHGIANTGALVLFFAAWLVRENGASPSAISLGLEVLGAALLAYSGWLGGTLVTRNLISVDHRYADAGEWQEESYIAPPGVPLVVCRNDDLKADQMKLLRINGSRIVVARVADGFTAFEDGARTAVDRWQAG